MTVGQPPPPPAAPESPVYPYSTQPRYPEGTWAGHPLASWWGRVGATLLDGIFVLFLVAGAVGLGVAAGSATDGLVGMPFYILGAVIWLLYAPLLMAREAERNGQTWGKQLVGLRVIREDRAPMAFGWSFIREFVIKTVVFAWLGGTVAVGWLLDVLWPLWDDENRALHDMLAKTRVVET